MPFTKEQLLETADQFAGLADDPRHGHLFAACAAGLRAWEARRGYYRKTVNTARVFLAELERHVVRVRRDGLTRENAQETAFAMVECLACMIREVALASGADTPGEEFVLSYFETCGEWRPEDTGLAAAYFFKRIPAAVLCRTAEVLEAGLHSGANEAADRVPSQ